MADVITRFKLETTQFDSKLRDTAKGLKEIARQASLGGKDFNDFSQKSLEAARALGTVQSGANNTKDKLRDLVGAYNDAANAYNSLTEAAKQGEFGRAMSESLQKLQREIKDTKEELYSISDSTKGVSGGLFGGKSITDMIAVAGGNIVATGITKLTSELAESVQQSIELAKSGEGVRIAFERLNQPGLLNNLKEATHGTVSEMELMKQAIKFDNFKLPLEDLSTYLAFAQQKAKDTGESIDYLVDSIVTGLGRQSKQILDNLGISASELTRRMNEGADMTTAVADIIREEMAKAGDYIETAADRAARASADATNQMEELGRKAIPVAEEWANVWNEIKIGGLSVLTTVLGPIAESIRDIREILSGEYELKIKANIPNLADGPVKTPSTKKPAWGDGLPYTAPGGYVEVTDKYTGAVIGGKHFDDLNDKNSISDWQKSLTKTTRTGGSKKSLPSFDDFDKALGKSLNGSVDLKETADALSPYQMMLPEIKKNILDIKDADLGGALAKLGDDEVRSEIDKMIKSLEQEKMAFSLAGQAAENFGAALAGMDDPAAKAAGTVLSAIANIALGFATASAQAGALGPFGWIAWLAAGTAALATTVSTVHSLTGYADGGVVQGNTFSGDQIPAMLNAGEVVLNRAEVAGLAGSLQNNGISNLQLEAVVTGEDLRFILNSNGRRTGRGEIVTSHIFR